MRAWRLLLLLGLAGPCRCSDGDWSIVQDAAVGDFSRQKMDATAQELSEERDAVAHLLG